MVHQGGVDSRILGDGTDGCFVNSVAGEQVTGAFQDALAGV
jgi:hypothetical protein